MWSPAAGRRDLFRQMDLIHPYTIYHFLPKGGKGGKWNGGKGDEQRQQAKVGNKGGKGGKDFRAVAIGVVVGGIARSGAKRRTTTWTR